MKLSPAAVLSTTRATGSAGTSAVRPSEERKQPRRAELDRHLGDAKAVQAARRGLRVRDAKQCLIIVEGRQRDVDPAQHIVEGGARLVPVGPAGRPEIAVEDDAAALRPDAVGKRCQRLALRRIENRERDPGQIQQVVAGQLLGDARPVRALQHLARRRCRAPVGEAPLAVRIGADRVETRQATGQTRHQLAADALGSPRCEHRIAVGVVAERGHVVDPHVPAARQAGEIHREIQRVAAEAELEIALAAMAQLDHALADARDLRHRRITPRG